MSQPIARRLAALLTLLALSCGLPEDPEALTAQGEQELATYVSQASQFPATLWPPTTRVCFRFTSNLNGAPTPGIDYAAAKAGLLDAMRVTWGVITGITFVDAGMCPAGTPPWDTWALNLVGDGYGGVCDIGRTGQNGAPGSCAIGVAVVPAPAAPEPLAVIKRVGMHEVGHGLGFGHEQQRVANATWEVPLCSSEFLNWQRGVGADNPDPGLLGLTVYDQRSIMNYCALEWGRPNTDYSPTSFDALGAEILYTRSTARPIVTSAASYRRADGVLVTRRGVDVMVDWSARGAVDSVYGPVTWQIDGASQSRKAGTGSAGTLPMGALSPAPAIHSVQGTFVDRYARSFALSPSLYTVDDNLHTALVMSTWGS